MDTLHLCAFYYLLAINALAFLAYGMDKWKARKAMWRIPESTLIFLAIIGGSIGAWCGMKVWHHKTLHKKFRFGIPLILVLQVLLACYLLWLDYYCKSCGISFYAK